MVRLWTATWSILMALAGLAGAETLPPLDATDRPNWRAVGIVNGKGMTGVAACSGALVAPNLVLTAAHCAFGPGGAADKRVFMPGGMNAGRLATFESIRIDLHPAYTTAPSNIERFAVDMALITLARPVPRSITAPLAVVRPAYAEDARFAIVAFDQMGPYQMKGRFDCGPVLPLQSEQLQLKCPVTTGNSGAPVLLQDEGTWQVIGVAVARLGRGAGSQALVARANDWLLNRIATEKD